MLRLLAEMKLDGSQTHMEYRTELEQLKQISRGNALDYWRLSWGVDDSSLHFGGGFSAKVPSVKSSGQGQSEPLPEVPKPQASPIPGTEEKKEEEPKKNENEVEVTVELH